MMLRDNHRASVGPEEYFDLLGGLQFSLLVLLGLREHHKLLDIGCGSLRGGKFFIPYLAKGNYYGIEPDADLLRAGVAQETGWELIDMKAPHFDYNAVLDLEVFGTTFDFILAQSIFSHAPRDAIAGCMKSAKSALTPEGLFVATFMQGPQNYGGDAWVFSKDGATATYTLRTMMRMAENAGLRCTQLSWPHPSGQVWLVMSNTNRKDVLANVEQRRVAARQALQVHGGPSA